MTDCEDFVYQMQTELADVVRILGRRVESITQLLESFQKDINELRNQSAGVSQKDDPK